MYANDSGGMMPMQMTGMPFMPRSNVGNAIAQDIGGVLYGQGMGLLVPTIPVKPDKYTTGETNFLGWGLHPYISDLNAFFCPSDTYTAPNRVPETLATNNVTVLGWAFQGYAMYGANYYERCMGYWHYYYPGMDYSQTAGNQNLASRGYGPIVNDRINLKSASERMYLTDQGFVYLQKGDTCWQYMMTQPLNHREGVRTMGWNALYLDGHVKWLSEGLLRNQATFRGVTTLYVGQKLTYYNGALDWYDSTFAGACNAMY
jgi:prepilin-type processing-associated H-X9-DG protein